jgi:membrane-bound ClpP family serine protease
MIIGLEYLILGLMGLCLIILVVAIIFGKLEYYTYAGVLAAFAAVIAIGDICLYAATMNAQDDVEKQYVEYLKLQTAVVQYEELDLLEQYEVYNDVMTYNTWYNLNKADLENEWSFKGSSGYAKEFDYIVIGG